MSVQQQKSSKRLVLANGQEATPTQEKTAYQPRTLVEFDSLGVKLAIDPGEVVGIIDDGKLAHVFVRGGAAIGLASFKIPELIEKIDAARAAIGVPIIPKVLVPADPTDEAGVYEFITGEPPDPGSLAAHNGIEGELLSEHETPVAADGFPIGDGIDQGERQ